MFSLCLFIWSCGDSDNNKTSNNDKISKAEAVAEISDYFQWPHPDDYNDVWRNPPKKFNDVKTTDEYGKLIEAAYEEGIINADDSGNFNPDSNITYGEAIEIMAEAFKQPEDTIAPYIGGANYTTADSENTLSTADFEAAFSTIKNTFVAPPYALPRQAHAAPRRYVKMYTPTPGATIYYTWCQSSDPTSNDCTEPTTDSAVYTVATKGHINHSLGFFLSEDTDSYITYKAMTVKEGSISSPIQAFTWHLHRLGYSPYNAKLMVQGTENRPTVYQIYNDAESLRPMAYYIEGSREAIVFDALFTQITDDNPNLAQYVRDNLLPVGKKLSLVVGHAHPDHDAQARNFAEAGYDIYANERGWSSRAGYYTEAQQSAIKNVDEGDSFDLGNCTLDVYALPGHQDSLVILQDKENGLIFATDIYGCTRAGSADNVNVAGLKVDRLLSFAQQTYTNYLKNNGRTDMVFTGHDETALADINLHIFEEALQQVIDNGEAACSPTLRGTTNADVTARTTLIGDMWHDGTNWIALIIGGNMGDDYEYLTNTPVNADGATTAVNYNGADGFTHYSVLSNIEIEGGELEGVDVAWADPATFTWAGEEITVENSLPNKFDPWTYSYTIKVPQENSTLTVIPTTMSTKVQSIKLNGEEVGYRSHNTVNVNDGSIITIDVVAPDNETTSSYTFTVAKY
ncbi:cadherin-like beta sandwich domain-containing protein [Pelobacter seleniigenes]|uniref:cadherin-like beta sandwich domain-containing protein n=1 Tax=Pelobacter seleniigenes TaxID=407188 RepID=UPI0004A71D61|nr:cadherin-like beta sandwich domain-containing protein [Pelobacter seleniigenes]